MEVALNFAAEFRLNSKADSEWGGLSVSVHSSFDFDAITGPCTGSDQGLGVDYACSSNSGYGFGVAATTGRSKAVEAIAFKGDLILKVVEILGVAVLVEVVRCPRRGVRPPPKSRSLSNALEMLRPRLHWC